MKHKFWKVTNITGGILLIALVIGGLSNSWGADIPLKYITYLSWTWIPIAILVWKNKI